MFGPDPSALLEGAKNFDFIGKNAAEIEAIWPLPQGAVVGNVEENLAFVVGVGTFYGERAIAALDYFIDGYDGHAGLLGAYSTTSDDPPLPDSGHPPTQARWTCHTAATSLTPGFYFIHAEVFPNSYGGPTDYQSFGAIRNIELKMVAPEG
jgi:hypothetical protein